MHCIIAGRLFGCYYLLYVLKIWIMHSMVMQCQLVKNFENRIKSLNIGIKCHSEINLETYGVDNTIYQAVLLFYCMANKQI